MLCSVREGVKDLLASIWGCLLRGKTEENYRGQGIFTNKSLIFKMVFSGLLKSSHGPPPRWACQSCRSPTCEDKQVGWEEAVDPFYSCGNITANIYLLFLVHCGSWINPVGWVFSSLIRRGNRDLKNGETEIWWGHLAPRGSLQHLGYLNTKYHTWKKAILHFIVGLVLSAW